MCFAFVFNFLSHGIVVLLLIRARRLYIFYKYNYVVGVTWMCRRCTESEPHRLKKSLEYKHLRKDTSRKSIDGHAVVSSGTKALPYDVNDHLNCHWIIYLFVFILQPDTLNWDAYHRVNMENIYCYCGRDGEWFTQMLQCGRCRQWFHEKCVNCLRYPLYCGDRSEKEN